MSPDAQDNPTPALTSGHKRGLVAQITGVLASVPFASAVVALIAVACVVGTLLPQGTQVREYLAAHPEREGLMAALGTAGLTDVFASWWFIGLLLLLAASLGVCSFRRYAAAMRRTGRPRGRALGSMVTHVSMLLVLCGGVVRVVWGERGVLELREGQTVSRFVSEGKAITLPFAIHLIDFEIEMYASEKDAPSPAREALHIRARGSDQKWSFAAQEGLTERMVLSGASGGQDDTVELTILQRIPDFVMDSAAGEITTRSQELRNPALQVQIVSGAATNAQWVFAFHPSFNMHGDGDPIPLDMRYVVQKRPSARQQVKDYRSTLQVIENDQVVAEKTIEVNDPLSHKGYTFYQSGYNPRDPEWTSLQVVKDPGVPLVYAGFLLLIAGLTMVFYLYPHGRHELDSGDKT